MLPVVTEGGGGGDGDGEGGGGGGGIKHLLPQLARHLLSQGSCRHLWIFSSVVPTAPAQKADTNSPKSASLSLHGGGGGEGDGGGGGSGGGGWGGLQRTYWLLQWRIASLMHAAGP